MKAKQVVCHGLRDVSLREIEISEDLGPHEVLIESCCSLISPGTETAIVARTHRAYAQSEVPKWLQAPTPLGYALAGVVRRSGAQSKWREGERVLAAVPHSDWVRCDGQKTRIAAIPPGVAMEEATLARLAGISMVGIRQAKLELGETVGVMGLGLIGHFAAQLASLAGGRPVRAFDMMGSRVAKARANGVVANEIPAALVGSGLQKFLGEKPEVVIEATGNGAVVPTAMEWVKDEGRVILLGSARHPVELDVYSMLHAKCISVLGAHENLAIKGHRWTVEKNLEVVMALMAEGSLKTQGLVGEKVNPGEIPGAYLKLLDRPADHLGMLIVWSAAGEKFANRMPYSALKTPFQMTEL